MANQYKEASYILTQMEQGHGSLRSLLYNNDNNNRTKRGHIPTIFALVTETLKYKTVLSNIIEESHVLRENEWLKERKSLVYVMVYDLLFGKKVIEGGGKIKKLLLKYEASFVEVLNRHKIKCGVSDVRDLLPTHIVDDGHSAVVLPRYVRVNLLKTTVQNVIEVFEKEGYTILASEEASKYLVHEFPSEKSIKRDSDIHSLLLFPPKTNFSQHPLLKMGHIILQDKASILAGMAMAPICENAMCIDACAAPGMKTQIISELLNNKGTIFALDYDSTRFHALIKLAKRHAIKNMKALNMSFLDIDPNNPKFKDIEYILVDPSCSGSGLVNRLDFTLADSFNKLSYVGRSEETESRCNKRNELLTAIGERSKQIPNEKERLQKLSQVQLSLLLHAFQFPKVRRIVYSTCSVYYEENEDVVKKALTLSKGRFRLETIYPHWKRRGIVTDDFPEALCCLRTLPQEDHMIGFFIACFVREASQLSLQSDNATPSSGFGSEETKKNVTDEHAAKCSSLIRKPFLPKKRKHNQTKKNKHKTKSKRIKMTIVNN